jgi:hypothetical protein
VRHGDREETRAQSFVEEAQRLLERQLRRVPVLFDEVIGQHALWQKRRSVVQIAVGF